ncbi:MAG: imidazole glycerol phosphate synthase subunit HisH [Syntrophomonas sp.]
MIVIVDYGMGNLGSILNMLKKIGTPAQISSQSDDIRRADKLILPGVGAFDNAMDNLYKYGLFKVLNEQVKEKGIPILGICLGIQLFTKRSEEGIKSGLGWLDAETVKFRFNQNTSLKTPHMGWNELDIKNDEGILHDLPEYSRFYFVHSYHLKGIKEENVIASSQYGYEFTAAVHQDNIWGTQFHPEKSHKFGLKLLKNFVEMV